MCANVCKCIHVHITSFAYKLSVLKIFMCNVNYRLTVKLIDLSNISNYLKTLKKDVITYLYHHIQHVYWLLANARLLAKYNIIV